MSTEPEHEIIPAIRAWLVATSDIEIPIGLCRKEARQRARDFLAAIVAGTIGEEQMEADDDSKDVLWAVVEELDERPLGQPTFEECDRAYQVVSALTVENDPFDEQDEVLHRVARIGWCSAPGGLEAVLKARAAIWEHGNEQRHLEVCETADQLSARIEALTRQQAPELAEIREICTRLIKLAGIYPALVVPTAAAMAALLASQDHRIGWLDDRNYLKAVIDLAAAMASRQLGQWDSARSGYTRAALSFRRAAETTDLDRVEVEHLALEQTRGAIAKIAESAPALIRALVIRRDKIKAQLVLASALIDLDRPQNARLILEAVLQDPVIENEPALKADLLTRLGTVRSYLGNDREAVTAFNSAGSILKRFFHPSQLAGLAGAVGEHLGKLGNLEEAAALYRAARGRFHRIGQARFVGYYSVLLAELMVLLDRNEEAETELLAALPLLETLDLRREAAAAVGLLREAMAKRRTDVTTIRALREQLRKGLH